MINRVSRKTADESVLVSTRMTPQNANQLRRVAELERRSISAQVSLILEQWLENHKQTTTTVVD